MGFQIGETDFCGAYKILLINVDGYHDGLFWPGIAFWFGLWKFDHIRIGQCGYDQKEEQQDE